MWQRLRLNSQPAIRSDDNRLTAWSWVFRGPVVFEGGYEVERIWHPKMIGPQYGGATEDAAEERYHIRGGEMYQASEFMPPAISMLLLFTTQGGGEQYGGRIFVDGSACHCSAWTCEACQFAPGGYIKVILSGSSSLCFLWPHRHNGMA